MMLIAITKYILRSWEMLLRELDNTYLFAIDKTKSIFIFYAMENSFIFAAALVNTQQDEIAVYICYYELE